MTVLSRVLEVMVEADREMEPEEHEEAVMPTEMVRRKAAGGDGEGGGASEGEGEGVNREQRQRSWYWFRYW